MTDVFFLSRIHLLFGVFNWQWIENKSRAELSFFHSIFISQLKKSIIFILMKGKDNEINR